MKCGLLIESLVDIAPELLLFLLDSEGMCFSDAQHVLSSEGISLEASRLADKYGIPLTLRYRARKITH